MRDQTLTQKARFVILFVEVVILCLGSYLAFGTVFPPGGNKGFWFYSALLGLVLGSRLDTPFFAKPADVVLYAAPAIVALFLGSNWPGWDAGEKVSFVVAVGYCVVAFVLGAAAILLQENKRPELQKLSNASRILAETLGAPRIIFTIVVVFALYAYHRNSAIELGIIGSAWALTALLSPLEGSVRLAGRLRRILQPNIILDADGEVAGYQTPGVILIRQTPNSRIETGSFVAIQDPIRKGRLALALDHVGRDEGLLLRAIEIGSAQLPAEMEEQMSVLPPNSVAAVSLDGLERIEDRLVQLKRSLVGLVAPDTSIETMLFEVMNNNSNLEEGRLVEVQIGGRLVTYQLVNGLTKEEIIHQKNTFGYARAQAQKIGEWDNESRRFRLVKWLPQPNAPVFVKSVRAFEPDVKAIGHFPGTDYGVTLRTKGSDQIGLEALVTHNTAILGILGIGKSSLALELVERMMAIGIKVVC